MNTKILEDKIFFKNKLFLENQIIKQDPKTGAKVNIEGWLSSFSKIRKDIEIKIILQLSSNFYLLNFDF